MTDGRVKGRVLLHPRGIWLTESVHEDIITSTPACEGARGMKRKRRMW